VDAVAQTAVLPLRKKRVQNARRQPPNAPSFVVENQALHPQAAVLDAVFAQTFVDDRLERHRENRGRFVRVDRQLAGLDHRDERCDVEIIRHPLAKHRQLRHHRYARRIDADLLVQLAQRGRSQIRVLGVDAAARKADLSGVIAQVRGTFDEHHAVRCAAKDSDDYGRLAANRSHVSELAQKTCVPCRGGVPPLTPGQTAPLLAQLDPGWRIVSREDPKRGTISLLERTYGFEDFASAMRAAVRIGDLAERQQHHPDLTVAWGRLHVEIWTHKIGGLTESDFIFAAKCDETIAG